MDRPGELTHYFSSTGVDNGLRALTIQDKGKINIHAARRDLRVGR